MVWSIKIGYLSSGSHHSPDGNGATCLSFVENVLIGYTMTDRNTHGQALSIRLRWIPSVALSTVKSITGVSLCIRVYFPLSNNVSHLEIDLNILRLLPGSLHSFSNSLTLCVLRREKLCDIQSKKRLKSSATFRMEQRFKKSVNSMESPAVHSIDGRLPLVPQLPMVRFSV